MSGKGETTRQAICERARELFCQRGFKGVTMQDICKAAGLSRGGLYRHFGSTGQIFSAILEGFGGAQNREIHEQILRGVPASLILEGLLCRYEAEMLDGGSSLSLAVCEFYSGPEAASAPPVSRWYEASRAGWEELIRYGLDTGEFSCPDPRGAFDLLAFAYQGARLWGRLMELPKAVPAGMFGQVRRLLLGPDMIRLERPGPEHRERALAFREEFFAHDEPVIFGSELLDKTGSYGEWLGAVTRNTDPATVNPDWVLTDTYFAVDGEEDIVGIIDLRHRLNGFLRDMGNCGYSGRPSRRGRGYGTQMLGLLTVRARAAGLRELHISVERDNIPSVRVIKGRGVVYERSFTHYGAGADVYLIAL